MPTVRTSIKQCGQRLEWTTTLPRRCQSSATDTTRVKNRRSGKYGLLPLFVEHFLCAPSVLYYLRFGFYDIFSFSDAKRCRDSPCCGRYRQQASKITTAKSHCPCPGQAARASPRSNADCQDSFASTLFDGLAIAATCDLKLAVVSRRHLHSRTGPPRLLTLNGPQYSLSSAARHISPVQGAAPTAHTPLFPRFAQSAAIRRERRVHLKPYAPGCKADS